MGNNRIGTEPSLTELRLRNTEAKLARLIGVIEPLADGLDTTVATHVVARTLRAAIEEARKP